MEAAGIPGGKPYVFRERLGQKMIQSLKNPQFRTVYGKGKSKSDKYLVMYIYPNGLEQNRLGITVSKKNGNSVVRSRHRFVSGYDIVIIARNASIDQKSTQMEKSVLKLAEKFHILKAENRIGE